MLSCAPRCAAPGGCPARAPPGLLGAAPYCACPRGAAWLQRGGCGCGCGEPGEVPEWTWTARPDASSSVVLSEDRSQVTFHPVYSSGTAVVRGDTPMTHNHQYYWEVKILTDVYGTDIMVGIGTSKVDIENSQFKFASLLGEDGESYGLSYKGHVRHEGLVMRDSTGFCKGTLVGVRVDMWLGTLEFFINRKPQGISFFNLRRHPELFPMLCSTAAQSAIRLTYAASRRASLLVDAAKMLAASLRSAHGKREVKVPPGLYNMLKGQFWLMISCEGSLLDENPADVVEMMDNSTQSMLPVVVQSHYLNGYYVDGVDREFRLVVRE